MELHKLFKEYLTILPSPSLAHKMEKKLEKLEVFHIYSILSKISLFF